MAAMTYIRYGLWALVVAVVAGVTAASLGVLPGDRSQQSRTSGVASIGGPFTLTATDGSRLSSDAFDGVPHMMFFGFTFCPDVCPTTLYEVSTWLDELGPDAAPVRAIFVSVDPERDTPDVLADYLSAFGDRIIGLTGTPDEIAKVAKDYRVFYQRVPLDDGDYTVDHTASIFLFRGDGSFFGTIAYGENTDSALDKLRRLARS